MISHRCANRPRCWPVPLALRFHELVNADIGEILKAVRSERTGTLVLGMNKRLILPESVELLRSRLSCPWVLVK